MPDDFWLARLMKTKPGEPRLIISGYDDVQNYNGGVRSSQTKLLIAEDQFPPSEKHFYARRPVWYADIIALWQLWQALEPDARKGGWKYFFEYMPEELERVEREARPVRVTEIVEAAAATAKARRDRERDARRASSVTAPQPL